MNREIEIKKMSDIIAPFFKDPIDIPCPYCKAAEALYDAGYRLSPIEQDKVEAIAKRLHSFAKKALLSWQGNIETIESDCLIEAREILSFVTPELKVREDRTNLHEFGSPKGLPKGWRGKILK